MLNSRILFVIAVALLVFVGACGKEQSTGLPVIDTVPPIPPVGLQAGLESGQVAVRWTGNVEPDLAGYRVYKSSDMEGPYGCVCATLVYCPWYYDDILPMQKTYYKVTAIDESGNESAFSQIVGVYRANSRGPRQDNPVE